MKLLVVSDSHGSSSRLVEVMELHRDVDAMIFLGDGAGDVFRSGAQDYPFMLYSVKGNCDAYSSFAEDMPEELVLNFNGYRFLILHGHTRGAKHGQGGLVSAAIAADADAVLFGHTHMPVEQYIPIVENTKKPLYLFNPGSLGQSVGGDFGIVEIRGRNILFSHGQLKK